VVVCSWPGWSGLAGLAGPALASDGGAARSIWAASSLEFIKADHYLIEPTAREPRPPT
jgi:hypothetical protein